jgi:hypothetical protein
LGLFGTAYLALNHAPRLFGKPKLVQHFTGRRWYHLHPSEDMATTASLNRVGGRVTWRKGFRQMNDCTLELVGDMAQKIRWQGFNSNLLRMFWRMSRDNPHMLNGLQKLDLMLGPLYNAYSFPALLYRLGIVGFVFGNVFSMMMLDPLLHQWSVGNPLALIMELGIVNYTMIELMIRCGRKVGGSPFGRATSDNFAYDSMYMWFNYSQTSLRLLSNLRARFNVTDPPEQSAVTKTWIRFREKVSAEDRIFRSFLRMSWDLVVLDVVTAGVVGWSYLYESGLRRPKDLMAMGMAMLIPWSLRTAYYTYRGMTRLNDGISPVEDTKKLCRQFQTQAEQAIGWRR